MKRDEYKRGLAVKLAQPLRVRCCACNPIPQGATVVLFDKISQNRANVGLYFEPDAPLGGDKPAIHHKVWPIGKWPITTLPPKAFQSVTGKAKDIFPQGGFCLHKVKISGIRGEIVGSIRPEIFECQ